MANLCPAHVLRNMPRCDTLHRHRGDMAEIMLQALTARPRAVSYPIPPMLVPVTSTCLPSMSTSGAVNRPWLTRQPNARNMFEIYHKDMDLFRLSHAVDSRKSLALSRCALHSLAAVLARFQRIYRHALRLSADCVEQIAKCVFVSLCVCAALQYILCLSVLRTNVCGFRPTRLLYTSSGFLLSR